MHTKNAKFMLNGGKCPPNYARNVYFYNSDTELEILLKPNTVNSLYNDIRYNSKIRYNVNLICTKISGSCGSADFFIDITILFFRKNIRFVYLLESPRRGDSNKYTKRMIYKKKVFKSIRH